MPPAEISEALRCGTQGYVEDLVGVCGGCCFMPSFRIGHGTDLHSCDLQTRRILLNYGFQALDMADQACSKPAAGGPPGSLTAGSASCCIQPA